MGINETDLIERRVRGGSPADESKQLLAALLSRHSGDNLVHALVYHGFATEAAATKFCAAR